MLGKAQILADTFDDVMHEGISLIDYVAALNKLYDKAFIKLKNKTEAMSVVCNAILNLDEVTTKD